MAKPESPFIAGSVVKEKRKSIGRKDIVGEILKSIPRERSILLHGQRRIGKTTILHRVMDELREKSPGDSCDYIPVFFDLQGKLGFPLDKLLKHLILTIRRACPVDCEIDPKQRPSEYFVAWLQEMAGKLEGLPRKKQMVWLFDEFDDIPPEEEGGEGADAPASPADRFYNYLATIFVRVAQVRFIAILGRDPDLLPRTARFLVEHSRILRVPLMSRQELSGLVDLSRGFLNWSVDGVDELWRLTRGHPFLAQLICADIWNTNIGAISSGKKLKITRNEIHSALSYDRYKQVVDYAWAILSPEEQVIACMLAESTPWSGDDWCSRSDIIDLVEKFLLSDFYSESGLDDLAGRLEKADWIERQAGGYRLRIKIPVYSLWIQQNHTLERLTDVLFDNQKRAFSQYLKAGSVTDDEEAIGLLEHSLNLDPDNREIRQALIERSISILDLCLERGNYQLALGYAARLKAFDAELAAGYERRAQASIQRNLVTQRIDSSLAERNFAEVRRQRVLLRKYAPDLDRFYTARTSFQEFYYTLTLWFRSLLFWLPLPFLAVILRKGAFPIQSSFALDAFDQALIFLAFFWSMAVAFLKADGQAGGSRAFAVAGLSLGAVYVLSQVLSAAGIAPIDRATLFAILLANLLLLFFNRKTFDPRKLLAAVVLNAFLGMTCFRGYGQEGEPVNLLLWLFRDFPQWARQTWAGLFVRFLEDLTGLDL